jgi:hypothetical protein
VSTPPLLPCVTVGISEAAGSPVDAPGLDVLLTTRPSPPAPWVQVIDLPGAVGHLTAATEAHPQASVVLAQLLRHGRGAEPIEADLLLESLAYSTLQAGPEHDAWLRSRPPRPPRTADADPPVLIERRGDVLSITLHRPHVRNAYNAAMRDALCDALSSTQSRQIHLRGAGPAFCSGGDLDEFGTRPDPATAHLVRTTRSAARLLATIGDRVTAHLHGACVGAGIELPALAGRVVAAPDTMIRLPEVAMGLIPGAGGTATLPRRIGAPRTAWLALTGAWLDAATAHHWGLVDEITPPAT